MVILLQSITQGACKVGLTERAPSATELSTLATEMFAAADRNSDSSVGMQEFHEWCAHLSLQCL